MKIIGVHRISNFKESDWLKKNIDFNTDKRKNAVNSFEKDFFKLMNKSIYGKTMENLRKRIKVRLVNDTKDKVLFRRKYLVEILLVFSRLTLWVSTLLRLF